MSAEWKARAREEVGGEGSSRGGYRLNRKPSPEQLLLRRFTWPTFSAEVTIISPVSVQVLASDKEWFRTDPRRYHDFKLPND